VNLCVPLRSSGPLRLKLFRAALRAGLFFGLACAILVAALWLSLPLVPLPSALFKPQTAELEFVDRNGLPLRAMRPDGSPFVRPVPYAEIPQSLTQATLAAEDRRYWNHPGVDWRGSMRAAWQLLTHRRVISGGSTITQQLIKLAAPRPRTLRTKLIEMVQALRLEQVWGKQQVLTEYLNRLDYGNLNRGCVAAAAFYFGKPLGDLSPAECALLAALPQAPTRLNPRAHLDRAIKRQRWVLAKMRDAGWLTADQFDRACQEPVQLVRTRRIFEAPHFIDLLLTTRGNTGFGPNSIRTTLDLELNRFAEAALRRHLSTLKAQHVSNGSLVVLDNRTGDILAMVGSDDYFSPTGGQVNGAWAPRSAGSTFKPFTYLLALEHGATPATVVADIPTEFAGASGLFAPVNYNHHCYGPMRYRLALANSLNIPAVKVLASVGGSEPLWRLLRDCGLTTLNRPAAEYGLGLTIGNAETRLLELANAYASLARLGEYRPCRMLLNESASEVIPHYTLSPSDGERAGVRGSSFHCIKVADPSAVYLIADILSDNDARLLAFGAESPLRFQFPVACKTGTSSDFRDNWAFGYTPEFTVGVWVGNLDGSPMQDVSGVTGAAPVLHELFEFLHQRNGTTWYATPTNIIECWINPITGKRKSGELPTTEYIREKFLSSNLPSPETESDYEPAGPKKLVRLANEYHDWFTTADNWLAGRAVLAAAATTLHIEFPPPGTTIYLDPDLPGRGGLLGLNALGPERLEWHSATLQITNTAEHWTALLTEGRHLLTVYAPLTGDRAETWVNVLER
jgi:penicillin-binding protein 1C